MVIKILGSGCPNCKRLEKHTRKALRETGLEAEVRKVTDMGAIASHGVMATPALLVDDEVLFSGLVPKPKDIASRLKTWMDKK